MYLMQVVFCLNYYDPPSKQNTKQRQKPIPVYNCTRKTKKKVKEKRKKRVKNRNS